MDASAAWRDRIAVNPEVVAGKAVIRGTRIAVDFVVELLAKGWTEPQIVENYPGIVHDDIQACLAYASDALKSELVYPLSAT